MIERPKIGCSSGTREEKVSYGKLPSSGPFRALGRSVGMSQWDILRILRISIMGISMKIT